MDNQTANRNQPPCQSWLGQNVWPTPSTQGPFLNKPTNTQHLSTGLSSSQRSFFDPLQVSNQNCVSELNSILSGNLHQSNLYKAPHISSGPSSTTLFTNCSIPNTSNIMSFNQHTSSMLPTPSKGKTVPTKSHSQQNQGLQPQHLPFHSSHNSYKASFQLPVENQNLPLGLQDLSTSLPSCGQRLNRPQASFEQAHVDSALFSGSTFGNALSSSEEQPQWTPSSHRVGERAVPDAAAHVNKKQKVNVTPQVDSEKQRSAILHQRAQLLKQLAEMDKLLEKIPQDGCSAQESPPHLADQSPSISDSLPCEQTETSDAQQIHSEEESQSLPEEDCLSPDSCDEREQETSDVPDNQSFSGESEENASDDDFDYGPVGDDDFPSDSDRDSAEESSHSSSSTFEGETPPQPAKKQPTPGRSFHNDKNASPVREACDTGPKPSEIVVLPSDANESRYSKRNYCLFCSRLVTKMARHLENVHSDRAEVAVAFQYPKKSKERKMIWNKLRNEGNFAHNKEVLKTGKGKLAVRVRPKQQSKVTDYIHCLYCRGLFGKKFMFKHMKNCPEKKKRNENEPRLGRQSIALRCVLEASENIEMSDGLRKVLCGMLYDDVTQTIINDKIILQFGEQMFSHYSTDAKKNGYLKQNLRHLGRLVLEAAKTTPLKNLEEFFCLSSFRHVVSTVNVLAGYDAESKTYKVPSLALKLGYHLQKACSIVQENAVKSGDDNMAESARRFLSAYEKKWNKLVSVGALSTLRESKLVTEAQNVPNVQDVKRLFFHIENDAVLIENKFRETPSTKNYSALAKVILAQTILFNRRTGLEVSSMNVAQFASLKKSEIVDDMDITVSDLERTMCGFFSRVDIRGNTGRIVPILLKPSFVCALELLIKVREKCEVPSQNEYLFGRPHTLSAYSGAACIQNYVKECGLTNTKALMLRNIQKHYGTMLQIMSLNEEEAYQVLGPDNQVQALRQNINMRLDDEIGSQNMAEHLFSNQYQTLHTKSVKSRSKGSQIKDKRKWGEAEVKAVEKHLMRFIQEHKVPQKDDCLACLSAEPGALRKRTWKAVKDYVRNRSITLQRQGGFPKASSTNRPQQVKRRHETRHTTKTRKTAPSGSAKPKEKGPKKKDKHKWGEEEVQAVERHMMRFIRGHKVPQKDDCLKCLSAETDALKTRTWKGVKDYVRNRIIALQRIGSSSMTLHTNSTNTNRRQKMKQTQKTPRTRQVNVTAPSRPVTSKDTGSTNKDKHKWGEEEVQAVERHMMHFIHEHKVPQKDDCLKCLSAEPEALRARTWKGVKDYVRNRITSLKRQGDSSWAS
ncbi:uncharacterized protein LOC114861677 isoform X2 [Betta splendens]|uniref:Uncharacterized protein LOC114861677 isoform X2 n=1 Tax=Betta splendens TaxID=158456 RepID=A0A8M1HI04_BETSP|nr:uncharacterized protein LOC114861677 isoform X2 [Betta splendens]